MKNTNSKEKWITGLILALCMIAVSPVLAQEATSSEQTTEVPTQETAASIDSISLVSTSAEEVSFVTERPAKVGPAEATPEIPAKIESAAQAEPEKPAKVEPAAEATPEIPATIESAAQAEPEKPAKVEPAAEDRKSVV